MNEFKKMLMQLWLGLSGPQKLSLAVTLVASLAALAAVVHFASKPRMTLLYSGVAAAEAAKIVEHLQSRKIPHEIDDGGASIHVPANKVHEVRLALAAQGIPRTADPAGGVGFELFDKPTFGMSDFMQKANYYRALQGELARTIKQMEEVQDARVLIVVPDERLFARERSESKASVFLRLRPGRRLSDLQVQAVRFLVANGVENLQPERVAVIDAAGRALAETETAGNLASLSAGQLNIVRAYEDGLRDKVQSMLDQVLGPGQSVVRVSAEMNFDAVTETAEKFDPKGSVPRSESTITETNSSRTTSGGGAAGVASNAAAPGGADGQAQVSQQSRETVSNQYEINRTVETRQRAAGTVKRVTTAVFVNARKAPASAGAALQALPRNPQELKALEDLIKAAVGFTQTAERADSLQVKEVEFADVFASEPAPPASASLATRFDRWLPWLSQGFLVVLAGAVLLYFRSIVQSSRKAIESREFSELLNRYETLTAATVAAVAEKTSKRHFSVDEMQKLIRENPSNTAQAIKQWLGRN